MSITTTSAGDEDQWRSFFAAAKISLDAAESADRELRLRVGSGFNVFDWIEPQENDLSRIMRDLLDSQGSHGQGDIFLQAALDKLFQLPTDIKASEFSHSIVITEAPTYDGRRIDILIDAKSRLSSIAIENKPWIGESQEQLEDYAKYLRQRHSGRSFCLIFLHGPNNAEPKSLKKETRAALEFERRFQTIPYYSPSGASLHQWLIRCAEICQADKVRWFLRDFASYVADQFQSVEEDVSNVAG